MSVRVAPIWSIIFAMLLEYFTPLLPHFFSLSPPLLFLFPSSFFFPFPYQVYYSFFLVSPWTVSCALESYSHYTTFPLRLTNVFFHITVTSFLGYIFLLWMWRYRLLAFGGQTKLIYFCSIFVWFNQDGARMQCTSSFITIFLLSSSCNSVCP